MPDLVAASGQNLQLSLIHSFTKTNEVIKKNNIVEITVIMSL